MEYLPGVSITGYCNERAFGVRERLELRLPVCAAIEHAHRNGRPATAR